MRIVLDTSAAVGIVMRSPGWELFEKAVGEAEWVESPDLLISEAANTCTKYFKFGNLSMDTCEKALERVLALPDEFVPSSDLYREAFAMAAMGQRPAYDMFFLVLARRNGAVLVSADKALVAFAAKHDVKTLS
jgi:predicted nucleic acid-binding protein